MDRVGEVCCTILPWSRSVDAETWGIWHDVEFGISKGSFMTQECRAEEYSRVNDACGVAGPEVDCAFIWILFGYKIDEFGVAGAKFRASLGGGYGCRVSAREY